MNQNNFPTMLKNAKYIILSLLIACAGLNSCIHDDFDQPPVDGVDPNLTPNITIADLKAMYSGTHFQITDSLVVAAVVVADDRSGNFYKSLVIQDNTAGILLRMDGTNLYADYPEGRKVYIQLRGLWLGEYNGLVQLGGAATTGTTNEVDYIPSALFDKFVIKGSLNQTVTPVVVTIDQLDNTHQNMLIRIDNIQVSAPDTGKTYADAVNQLSANVVLEDCNDNEIILRNSGFADFAGQPLPNGNGSITAIYSVFGTDRQLLIRDTEDLDMNGSTRCPEPYVFKDFEDGSITSGGWSVQQVTGPQVTWTINTQGAVYGDRYAQCRNYVAPNNIACETWLISPSMDLTAATSPKFTFENACNYNGAALAVYYSTDYVSGLPSTGTWTVIPVALSSGSWAWTNSGLHVLPNAANVHVAFKYTGSSSDGKTWEIDNILVDNL